MMRTLRVTAVEQWQDMRMLQARGGANLGEEPFTTEGGAKAHRAITHAKSLLRLRKQFRKPILHVHHATAAGVRAIADHDESLAVG